MGGGGGEEGGGGWWGLGGVAHTWKHFSASLRATRVYYHNYNFKAAVICIRRAPTQPAARVAPLNSAHQRPLSR